MLDMGQLMGHHARQFFWGEQAQDAFGGSHGRMRGAPARGERIGRLRRNHVNLGHREACPLDEPRHRPVQWVVGSHRLRSVHPQNDPIGEPVRSKIHREGQDERDHESGLSSENPTDHEQKTTQRAEQDCCFEGIAHGLEFRDVVAGGEPAEGQL